MLRRQFLTVVLSGMVAAVARGYTDPAGYHRHRCNKDGFIWSHKPGGSHICPLCGRSQYVHYQGNDPPTAKPQVAVAAVKPQSTWEH